MAPSFLPHWMRLVYRVLQYTYPPDFRRRYGREMEQAFGWAPYSGTKFRLGAEKL